MPTVMPSGPVGSRRPSAEHLVLGVVLVVVVAAAGWFLTHRGSAAPAGKPLPRAAATTTPPSPPARVKPAKRAKPSAAKAAYLKAGNKLCARMNADSKALGDFPTTSAAVEADYVARNDVIITRTLARLRALKPPAADAAKVKTLYAGIARTSTLAKKAEHALRAGDRRAADSLLHKLAAGAQKSNAAFVAYGLTVCGS